MVARDRIELPTRGFSDRCRGSRSSIINHLQRLPAPSPASPRHIHGTPNLSSTHSWHTGVYDPIATTSEFCRTSSSCPASHAAISFTTASTRISTRLLMASARRSSAWRSRSLRNVRTPHPGTSQAKWRHFSLHVLIRPCLRTSFAWTFTESRTRPEHPRTNTSLKC
jgi:hypothetical protein